MALINLWTDEERAAWDEWLAGRPPQVRAVAEKLPPNKLYRLRDTGHRVTLYSVDEGQDGSVTVTVLVTGQYNAVAFERRVFGVAPENLEECELPSPDEELGSLDLPVDAVREMLGVRPNTEPQ